MCFARRVPRASPRRLLQRGKRSFTWEPHHAGDDAEGGEFIKDIWIMSACIRSCGVLCVYNLCNEVAVKKSLVCSCSLGQERPQLTKRVAHNNTHTAMECAKNYLCSAGSLFCMHLVSGSGQVEHQLGRFALTVWDCVTSAAAVVVVVAALQKILLIGRRGQVEWWVGGKR